jgi:hypothetical protein
MRLDDKSVQLPIVPCRCGSGRLFLIPKALISIAAYNTSPGQAGLDLAQLSARQKNEIC